MSALDLLRGGDLGGALAALQDQVRKDPSEPKHRIFLFQLFCVLGDYNKAMTQLRLCAQLDAATLPMAQTYREAIGCEFLRERVFAGQTVPLVFGEPQQWIALLVEAQQMLARGEVAAAERLRANAFDAAPATAGALNGEPFAWIADADMRLGPVLEIIMDGKYYWAPFNRIRRIAIEAPSDLRDRVWTPAMVTWANGGEVAVLIPTRYPGAAALEEDALKLSAGTRWDEVGEGLYLGRGQRVLATDAAEVNLMDVRMLALEVEGAAPGEDAGDPEPGVPAGGQGDV